MVLKIERFDIVWVRLDPTVGKENKKTRPCVVVSPNELNNTLDTVVIVPLTSTIREWPFRLKINNAGKTSSMAFDQIRSISKARITSKNGSIKTKEQEQALDILKAMFAD